MTTLRLYNTLTRTKEDFVPLDPNNVRMYVCGPTVYDYAHIGNARPAIVFDVLYRLLRHLYPGAGTASDGSRVTYVRNVTDIDDKIIERAKERGISIHDLTEKTYAIYQEDVAALGNLPPTHMPRATENVGHMIVMIERLIAAGHAYEASGHVLFDVSSKPDYGKLSRRTLDDMIAGARVDVAPYKKNPMDFVLWKPSDASTPGWDSPWGRGRPGWHIECSSMIETGFAGTDTIDIHGGGIDLVFPHHENEIAQSEGAHHDHPLARTWMHNGFLNVEGDKMSKSLGNFVTIHELRNRPGHPGWAPDALRFNMLRAHYRQPIDWNLLGLGESFSTIKSFFADVADIDSAVSDIPASFFDAIYDDLNTPEVIKTLHEMKRASDRKGLRASLEFLGFTCDPGKVVAVVSSTTAANVEMLSKSGELDRLIAVRDAARACKDFKESDRIRDELAAQGIALKDNPDGTTSWEVKR